MPTPYRRLTQPMVRRNGELQVTSWDDALDAAADGFARVLAEHGPDATGIFSCSRTTNEMNHLAAKLARTVFRTHNIDSCNRT